MDYFLSFYLLNSPKNENVKKILKKGTPGDIIILNNCTKNHNQMLYCSWDMVCDGYNCCFSFWAIFWSFTPLTARKMKISKQYKKTPVDIIILHKCSRNQDHMRYYSWDIVCDRCNCYFLIWVIFCPFTSPSPPPQTIPKMKIWKKWKKKKKTWRYFTQVYKKSWSYAVLFLRYGIWKM